nr:antigen-presenting glycoprotein CD1d-like [Chrysemys picta bellii]
MEGASHTLTVEQGLVLILLPGIPLPRCPRSLTHSSLIGSGLAAAGTELSRDRQREKWAERRVPWVGTYSMWATPDPLSGCPDTCHSPDPPSSARMLLPLLLLPWAWGALAASPHLPPASLTLRVLKTTVFHNASSTDMQGMALLGDLETHSMDCSTCEIRFLQPWAQQGLTPKQWQDLELLIHCYLSDFFRLVNKVVKDQGEGYPFVTQVSFSCKLHPNGTLISFCDAAVNGEDFISFDMDTGKWVSRHRDKLGSYVQDLVNQDKSISTLFPFLQRTMCVYGIDTFAQYGRESLERQEQSRPWGPGLAVGITLGALAVAAVAVVLWRSRRRGYQDIRPGESRP